MRHPACAGAVLRYPARMQNPFVSTEWLAARLDDPNFVILDSSWYLPTASRKPYEEYLAGHIPGAIFFDMDGVADKSSGLPHMLLAPKAFGEAVGELGIGDGVDREPSTRRSCTGSVMVSSVLVSGTDFVVSASATSRSTS